MMSVTKLKQLSLSSLHSGTDQSCCSLLLIFFLMLIVIIILYISKRKATPEPHVQTQYSRVMKEMCHLLFYPIIFSIVYSLSFINRVYYAATHSANLPLWILHASVDPCLSLIIPLAFFLHPNIRKRLNCLQLRQAANSWRHSKCDTHFVVPNEDSDISDDDCERLIVYGRMDSESGLQFSEGPKHKLSPQLVATT